MRNKKTIISLLLCMCMTFMLVLSGCNNKDKLMLNFKQGDSFNVEENTNLKTIMTVSNQNIETDQNEKVTYNYKIVDVDKNNIYTIKSTIKTMYFKQASTQGNIEYDSSKNASNSDALSKMMNSVIGKSYILKITSNGEVKEINGVDEIINDALSNTGLNEKDKSEVLSTFNQIFNNEALKQQIEQMFRLYPDKKVNVGDKWNRNTDITAGIPMLIDSTMQFKEEKDGIAYIAGNSKIKVNEKNAVMNISGMKFNYNLTGDENGSFNVKEDSGIISDGKINQKLSGTICVDNGQIIREGFPISIESSISYKMSK